jgi:hypothetical protein
MMDLDPMIREWLQKEMKFERNFVAAGGMLLAGCDPTASAQTLAGFGDPREVELLVEGDSRRSKRFTSPRKMARRSSVPPTELGAWRQASRRICCYSMATSRKTSR